MKIPNLALAGVLIVSIFYSSCTKENNIDWTSAEDNAIATELFQDIYIQIDKYVQSTGYFKSCPTVSVEDTSGAFPNKLTIDFGLDCLGIDGRERSGVIFANFSGYWRESGTVVELDFFDYSVNDYSINGDINITTENDNVFGNLSYTVNIANAIITNPNGEVLEWNGEMNFEWVHGQSTNYIQTGLVGISDDIYNITGTASGVDRNGNSYVAIITEPLVRNVECKWIVEGLIEVIPEIAGPQIINFGDGDCDAQTSFSSNQGTYNFLLL